MVSRSLTPDAWNNLSRVDRLEMMAYQQALNERRDSLRNDVIAKLPFEFSALAQVIINAME